MKYMQSSVIKTVSLLAISFLFLYSCDTTDPFEIPPPDFSTVPDAFDINGLESSEVEEGITAYVHEEGTGQFTVTIRDNITMHISLRTTDGNIIYSTYHNGRTDPITISTGGIQLTPNIFSYSVALAYTPGLKKGIIGMREGEVRTLIITPENGYGSLPSGAVNGQYRESTLQYDIELTRITN